MSDPRQKNSSIDNRARHRTGPLQQKIRVKTKEHALHICISDPLHTKIRILTTGQGTDQDHCRGNQTKDKEHGRDLTTRHKTFN